ncbi:hypothetical protein AXW67_19655 [Bradyrhizobium neotropicale]|uniref:Uncharacterized protein n=1 Tax=Bradyrhizobium neotropicale TaxID=1497615 RepID=A0A176YZY4_9BRAD|nr:hypothetical protein AXW67_19655 [Bradyrhizobium neotropicale]
MSRARQHFRRTDLAKTVKTLVDAGLPAGVQIRITAEGDVLVSCIGREQDGAAAELDRELAEFEARHAD